MSFEWDKFSVETYKANFGEKSIYGDITEVSLKDIPKHDILSSLFMMTFNLKGS
jgi:DNA (cytosine-5)-methyltransferase 1